MMLSREQGDCCAQSSDAPDNREFERVRRGDATAVGLSPLPLASDNSCCSTGFGGSQVSGANSAREIGGLGQMRTEVAASGECCVAAGCGCSPDADAAARHPEGQAPFGVNEVDGAPVDGVCCQNVGHDDSFVGDVEPWAPEGGVYRDGEKSKNGDAANKAVCCEGEQCCSNSQAEHGDRDHAENSAGAGHEGRHENNGGMKVER